MLVLSLFCRVSFSPPEQLEFWHIEVHTQNYSDEAYKSIFVESFLTISVWIITHGSNNFGNNY